jgi:non-specific serine/threonine protein kinase
MAVEYRGELVVMGGYITAGDNVFGPASDRVFALRDSGWSELARLRRPRGAGAAAVVNDGIVVVGGANESDLIGPTEVFDGTRWRDSAPIPTPRDHLAAASDGRAVFAVGGRPLDSARNFRALERFDPATDSWERLAPMPTPRGGLGAAVHDGRLIVMGGEEPAGVIAAVEQFDIVRGAWSPLPPMRTPRHGIGAAVVGSAVYALDGGLRPGLDPAPTAEALALS